MSESLKAFEAIADAAAARFDQERTDEAAQAWAKALQAVCRARAYEEVLSARARAEAAVRRGSSTVRPMVDEGAELVAVARAGIATMGAAE